MLGADFAMQTPLLREPALPLAMRLLVTAPVVLLFGSKLAGVIRPCLARRQRFGDGQHAHVLHNVRGSISFSAYCDFTSYLKKCSGPAFR